MEKKSRTSENTTTESNMTIRSLLASLGAKAGERKKNGSRLLNGLAAPWYSIAAMNSHHESALVSNPIGQDAQWVVQKFGGTSVGKFMLSIVDRIIQYV
jgi:hypothetical protein